MELPVLSFNSGKYDINMAKNPFFTHLVKHEQVQFVMKRNNNHTCLKTIHLKFLDITNYLAPWFSHDQFLKAYDCTQTKGYFPYEWVDSLEKLEFPALPPPETLQHFLVPTLLRNNTSTASTCGMIIIWKLFNFLIWYNNCDVVPFLKAIDKMSEKQRTKQRIDIFKDGVSVPGLTMKYLFSNVPNVYFSLFTEKDKDVYYTMKDNVGGPSIFNRYHETRLLYAMQI